MVELQRFAEQATPVATDLRKAAPGLTGATKALRPFSRAATISVTNLGDNAAASSSDLAGSAPVIRQLKKVAETAIPGAKNLKQLLSTLRKTGGIDYLTQFILNGSNTLNNFDSYGHFLLSQIQITNCIEYVVEPKTGCDANWFQTTTTSAPASPDQLSAPQARGKNDKSASTATADGTRSGDSRHGRPARRLPRATRTSSTS